MMQQTMGQRSMQMQGNSYHSGQMGMQHPDAMPQHAPAPITIHNHVGVEQTAEAKADQKMENHMWAAVSAKLKQAMKHLGSGPWPLILAGAGPNNLWAHPNQCQTSGEGFRYSDISQCLLHIGAGGLLFREFGGRFLFKNAPGRPTNAQSLRDIKKLKIERRVRTPFLCMWLCMWCSDSGPVQS